MSVVGDVFGSSEETSSTSKRELDPPSQEELHLINQQLTLATNQLKALTEIGDFTTARFQEFLPVLQQQVNKFLPQHEQITGKELSFASRQIGAQDFLLNSELAAIGNGVQLTPDQDRLISDAANAAIESGLSDIRTFRDESLESIARELAPSRGLRTDDTPILDVGGRVATESERTAAQLINNVRGAEYNARLSYPIQAGQFQAQRTQAQQQLASGTAAFQEQLRQQAFNNRLQLTSLTGQQGLGLSTIGPNPSTLAGLQNLRLNTGTETTNSETSSFNFMDAVGAAGGFMSGLGSMGVGFSDRRLKTEIHPVGDLKGHVLYRYRFKGDPKLRLGVMADELPVEYRVSDPSGYEKVNYGKLMRAA